MTSIRGLAPPSGCKSVILAACDTRYCADHAVGLAYSVRRNAPDSHFHLHVVNPEPGLEDGLAVLAVDLGGGFTWTTNEVDLSRLNAEQRRAYYACARFLAAPLLMTASPAPMFIVDADCIVRKPLAPPAADVGMFLRPDHPEHMRVAAGLVYAAPTQWGRRFLTDVCDSLSRRFREDLVGWYMDQLELWRVLIDLSNQDATIVRFDTGALDWEFSTGSAVWTAKGPRKKSPAYLAEANTYAFDLAAVRARFWGEAA